RVEHGKWIAGLAYPNEHASHLVHGTAGLWAFATALAGFVVATLFYGTQTLSAERVAAALAPVYRFLRKKWYFDELYHAVLVVPVMFLAKRAAEIDRQAIDGIVDGLALFVRVVSLIDDLIDRWLVDGLVNL